MGQRRAEAPPPPALSAAVSSPVQVLCCLLDPVSAVVQSLASSALTDLLQELQGSEGQLTTVLQNKVRQTAWRRLRLKLRSRRTQAVSMSSP